MGKVKERVRSLNKDFFEDKQGVMCVSGTKGTKVDCQDTLSFNSQEFEVFVRSYPLKRNVFDLLFFTVAGCALSSVLFTETEVFADPFLLFVGIIFFFSSLFFGAEFNGIAIRRAASAWKKNKATPKQSGFSKESFGYICLTKNHKKINSTLNKP